MSITPLFILGSSYRCGSTLLQRLFNAHEECFIFGEDNRTIKTFRQNMLDYNTEDYREKIYGYQKHSFQDNKNCWQANLGQNINSYAHSCINFINNLYLNNQNEIQEHGKDYDKIKYVGFKMLFAEPDDVRLLKSFFPSSHIIFLYRNFHDSWKSFAQTKWAGYTPVEFFRLWSHSIICLDYEIIDDFIRYEDIHTRIYDVLNLLNIKYDDDVIKSILNTRLRHSTETDKRELTPSTKIMLENLK